MTRDEFRQQMELYRQAREQNPQLSYWEWKSLLGEIVDKANQSDVNFVDRLNQFNRQTIPDWSGEGDVATHRMSWAEDENGNAIVYPEVQEINGKLHDFTDPRYNHGKWDALDSAIERGDTIHMTPFEAQQFTGGYKNFYPKFNEGTNKEGIQSNNFEYKDIPMATKMRQQKGLSQPELTDEQQIVQNEIQQARDWNNTWLRKRKQTGRFDDQLTDDYLQFASNRLENIPVFVKENDTRLGTANGIFTPNLIRINYNPNKDISYSQNRQSNILHELSHAVTIYNNKGANYNQIYSPQILKINKITGAPLQNTQSTNNIGEYESSAAEIYPRLQQMRYEMNADPNKNYTYDELKTWLQKYKLDFGKEKSEQLMNDVAQVDESYDGYKPQYLSDGGTVKNTTSEIPVTYSNGKWNYGYNPGAGFLKPVISIQDAADLTPVGNAITANDVYQSASQGDYITAGLIGAAALLPGAISKPLKKIVREIPSVNPKYFSDKINKVLGREVRPNGLSRDVYTDAINQRNRVIEDLYTDQDYWDRARAINERYGDDYTKVYKGVLDTYENKYTGLPEPKAKSFFGDAKAEMAARKDAMERFRMNKIPAGYTDFEYNISPHLDRIDRPTAQHELGHCVDFNLSQNANADYNNNMFSALRRDLSTDNNPLYPDKTDYFRQGTEQKSYMNTLRSYMQSIGLMDRPGQKVTTKTIKRAINSLPSEMNAIRAAYLQFSSPGKYTKWFNKIPLLSIPGAAMYLDSKEDNSYSDGTDGITQSYSLPEIVVTPSEYQNYYMENIRPKDMPEGEYFLKTILPPGLESTRFTKEQQDDRLRKLKEIYELAGEPTVHYKGIIDRPHYIPILNSIYSANNDYNLISELAHPIQLKKGKNRHFVKNAINNTIDDIRGNKDYYKDKDNYEYETHSIIEPALRNYIQNKYDSLEEALK